MEIAGGGVSRMMECLKHEWIKLWGQSGLRNEKTVYMSSVHQELPCPSGVCVVG